MRVSIIMPIYNQERYLKSALQMALNQTYSDLEVVAINDGSNDSSLSILESFASKDDRLKVITQSNRGLLGANVTGIKSATGEYIGFFDPDDEIGPDYVESFISMLDQPYDFVARGITYRFPSGDVPFPLAKDSVIGTDEIRALTPAFILDRSLRIDNTVFVSRWNKIYKTDCLTSFVDEYSSCEGASLGEDTLFTYLLLWHASKGRVLRAPSSYRYVQHGDSMTHEADFERLIRGYNKTFDVFMNLISCYSSDVTPAKLLYFGQMSSLLASIADCSPREGASLYRRFQHSSRYREALECACNYASGKNINAILQLRHCPANIYVLLRQLYCMFGRKQSRSF